MCYSYIKVVDMKVLIYENKGKDINSVWIKKLTDKLSVENIEYQTISKEDLDKNLVADVLISLGGDGTILLLNTFANRQNIPIVGINMGKLGFLTEFEPCDIETAIDLLKSKQLLKDERMCAKVEYNGKSYIALNEAYVQRIFDPESDCYIARLEVYVDDCYVSGVTGDGVIINTPTGTTGYALSAGGSILAPSVNAFSITPISAHSLSWRPIVGNSNSIYRVVVKKGSKVGLFVDGKYVATLSEGEEFTVEKYNTPTIFLRKKDFDFFKRFNFFVTIVNCIKRC